MAATGDEQPGSATYGIALLSRYPVVSWRVVRLPALRAGVPMWFKGSRRPIWVHDEPRVAVAAVIDGPFGEFTVCNTHLSFIPGWSALQLRRLVRSLTGTREPLVLLGDLNMEQAPGRAGQRAAPHRVGRHVPGRRTAAAAGPRAGPRRAAGDRGCGGGAAAAVGPPRARRPVRAVLTCPTGSRTGRRR